METLLQNIKNYFTAKEEGENSNDAPKGMCPVCWGHDEWDGKQYQIVKDKHLTPGHEQYESFISKIAEKHVKTTHKHENTYICTTCDTPIN